MQIVGAQFIAPAWGDDSCLWAQFIAPLLRITRKDGDAEFGLACSLATKR